MTDVAAAVAEAQRAEWGRIVATLIRITGDWSLAEDCAADAVERALHRWPTEGIPSNPGAWLTTVARNRAIDRLRRAASEISKLEQAAVLAEIDGTSERHSSEQHEIVDDRLRLIFTCCHPALPLEARVALTLRTVAGLSTDEIARAFLVPSATMGQRLVRAQRKIRNAGIPYRVPPGHLLQERLGGVLAVLYLLFNEGYSGTVSIADEAIRISRALVLLMPEEPEATALLALMLLQHSRHDARLGHDGGALSFEEQDRSLWHREAILEGAALVDAAGLLRGKGSGLSAGSAPGAAATAGDPGPYELQAAIAACHALAADPASTDFGTIASLYSRLARIHPSPVIELNRAVAIGLGEGPAIGLRLVDELAAQLAGYYLVPAAQADFLRRLGQMNAAAARYREALALVHSEPERRYLERRLAEVLAAC